MAGSQPKEPPFERQCGQEYKKHLAFRSDHGLVDAEGIWIRSKELLALEPDMRSQGVKLCSRGWDLLHIIWLMFEKRGVQASRVNQAWMLCQSIWRTPPPFAAGFFKGKHPGIPGLHLAPRGRHARQTIAPCVLPKCNMWLNAERRMAFAVELLALQALHAPTLWPGWQQVEVRMLRQVAGDMNTLTVMGWYMLLALLAVVPRSVECTGANKVAGQAIMPEDYEPKSLAKALVSFLVSVWPDAFTGCRLGRDTVVSIGSLCSGGDFAKDFLAVLASSFPSTLGVGGQDMAPGAARVRILDSMACEWDRKLWLAAKVEKRTMPVRFYSNVHTLPCQQAPAVDICIITGMCTAISGCNRYKMSLRTSSSKNVSKNTLDSCMRYVEAKTPKVVIMENVATLAWAPKVASVESEQPSASDGPDVNYILHQLVSMGYVCGYDLQDSCNWWVPQSRLRTYVWAHLPMLPGAAAFGDAVRRRTPGAPVLPFPWASSLTQAAR